MIFIPTTVYIIAAPVAKINESVPSLYNAPNQQSAITAFKSSTLSSLFLDLRIMFEHNEFLAYCVHCRHLKGAKKWVAISLWLGGNSWRLGGKMPPTLYVKICPASSSHGQKNLMASSALFPRTQVGHFLIHFYFPGQEKSDDLFPSFPTQVGHFLNPRLYPSPGEKIWLHFFLYLSK